ncbi:MAG: ATP-dependent Clp protease ATP-binding subunit [Bacteroidetes bacterium]|nr:ATP-dependent Clp protease ATP-binding subunit [Bacteroidota bacterium]
MDYPILIYQVNPDWVLGLLVGTRFRTAGPDKQTVIQELSDFLHREYKKFDWYPWIDLFEYKMKHQSIAVRPMVEDGDGAYPWPDEIRVPVTAIYGKSEDDSEYICYIPLLGVEFYYYQANQFSPLFRHMAVHALMELEPDRLFRMSQYPEPLLEKISLRINYNRNIDKKKQAPKRQFKKLERLADQYPPTKSDRKWKGIRTEQVWERDQDIKLLIDRILVQRSNVLLVGDSGVGKSAILSQAIRRIDNMSRRLKVWNTFWRLQPQRITASSKYLGEWQESVQELINDLRAANGVLWVENIIQLARTGGSGAEDSVAYFMYPYILRGEIQIVGEITPAELDKLRQLAPDFANIFQTQEVKPLSEMDTIRVLEKYARQLEKKDEIAISSDSILYMYRLLERYKPEQQFPGKGIRFLAQVFHWVKENKKKTIGRPEIIRRFSQTTGLPEIFLRDDLLLDQKALRKYFQSRIIGQDTAIENLIEIVKVYKAGLNNPNKPITTLLFAGPTGVGKTASARALSSYFFGQGQKQSPLIRIDMSEFQFSFQLSRLIGDARQTGQLVKEMRGKPFAVLLLDEVEKANPIILDALLGLLDEGRMTDAGGRTIHFQNSIVILTTNLGAGRQQSIGYTDTDGADARYNAAIRAHFRPEFLNRIDQLVFFSALNQQSIKKIAAIEIKAFAERPGFKKRNIQLKVSNQLMAYLSEIGFDVKYGARPLQRTIDQQLGKVAAEWMSAHPTKKNCVLRLDYIKGEITAKGEAKARAAKED